MPEHPLGRRIEFDERSRLFEVSLPLREQPEDVVSRCWPIQRLMDQGQLINVVDEWGWDPSSCTGFSRAHACNASPVEYFLNEHQAFNLYRMAQVSYDQWDDTPPSEGSSVIAAAKAAQELGYLASYWWAFSIDDLVSSIAWIGPGVAGSWWTADMFDSDHRGFIRPTGPTVGGHAYCIGGVILELNAAVIYQSWGPITTITDESVANLLRSYDVSDDLMRHIQLIDLDDLWNLLQQEGEYCVSLDTQVSVEPEPEIPEPQPEPEKPGCLQSLFRRS